jgi:hypothetical protein
MFVASKNEIGRLVSTMISRLCFLAALSFLISVRAAHPFLACDYLGNKVCVVSAEGKIEKQFDCPNPQDCWRLPNGNFLFCYRNGAREVTPENATVWEYKAAPKVEVHACQPLANGNVLIAEGGSARVIEVDRSGAVAKELKLPVTPTITTHEQIRGARKLANGHYLLCLKGDHKVVEIDEDGKTVREIKVPGDVHEAVALTNGNILIACGDGHKVMEVDRADKVVWEVNENDLPNNPLRLCGGLQRLPNGNTIICNYLGHGHLGKQPQFVEVTREKKVVWEFRDDVNFKTINQVQLLDVSGDVVKGEILR